MYTLYVIIINIFIAKDVFSCTTEETELVLSFMIFRHGDKTPIKPYLELVKYKAILYNLTKPYGFGQLTPAGMRKGYALGEFIKNRYDPLLSPCFDPAEVFVRSTFISRTILTALNAIAAMYNVPQPDWIKLMDWTPLPYSTVVPKYDFNTAYANCPVFLQYLIKVIDTSNPIMKPFMWMRDTLFSETGFDIAKHSLLSFGLYDLLISQESVGYKLSEKLKILLPDLKKAADASFSVVFGSPEVTPLLSGVLLNEFFKVITKVMAGEHIRKLYMYAAHDVNVYSFMTATQVYPSQGNPLPGSLFSLELRRGLLTGKYYILPIYVSQPGKPITYLNFTGCGNCLCEFNKFHSLTFKNALDVDSWRSKCNWNSTMYISDCVIT